MFLTKKIRLRFLSSILAIFNVFFQTPKINIHAFQIADFVYSKKKFFNYDFNFEKCKKMINNSSRDYLLDDVSELGFLLFEHNQIYNNDLKNKLDYYIPLPIEEDYINVGCEQIWRNRCIVCLMGLNKYGSNCEDLLKSFKNLRYDELGKKISTAWKFGEIKQCIILATIFSQRLGFDHILSKDDFEDICKGIEKFNNNKDFEFKEFVEKCQKERLYKKITSIGVPSLLLVTSVSLVLQKKKVFSRIYQKIYT